MITLIAGEPLLTDSTLKVYNIGQYNLIDLVMVIKDGDDIALYQYQANYIITGENL